MLRNIKKRALLFNGSPFCLFCLNPWLSLICTAVFNQSKCIFIGFMQFTITADQQDDGNKTKTV